jgi:hypothetical protein
VMIFYYVLKSALFNRMRVVWHLICLTCFSWNYGCDVVCMLYYGMSYKKTGGLGTKASVD